MRGRIEARGLIPFAASAEQTGFPGVAQAARLTRCLDSDRRPARGLETEWLITSPPRRPVQRCGDAGRRPPLLGH